MVQDVKRGAQTTKKDGIPSAHGKPAHRALSALVAITTITTITETTITKIKTTTITKIKTTTITKLQTEVRSCHLYSFQNLIITIMNPPQKLLLQHIIDSIGGCSNFPLFCLR